MVVHGAWCGVKNPKGELEFVENSFDRALEVARLMSAGPDGKVPLVLTHKVVPVMVISADALLVDDAAFDAIVQKVQETRREIARQAIAETGKRTLKEKFGK